MHFAKITLIVVFVITMSLSSAAATQDEDYLDLLPLQSSQPDKQSATSACHLKTFLEDELQYALVRDTRIPDGDTFKWFNRASLDLRADVTLARGLSLNLSDRVNSYGQGTNTSLLNDFKEFYAAYRISDTVYLDAGRINIRNGAAIGYNPTDYFKVFAANNRVSDDPSVLMDNRLGTVVLRGQLFVENSSLTLAYAPPLANPHGAVWTERENSTLNLGRTNSHSRFFASFDTNFFKNLNAELLFYNESGQTSTGLNLSATAAESVVLYAEWNGKFAPTLLSSAAKDAYKQLLSGLDDGNRLRNQLTAGISISPLKDVNTWVEYDFNGRAATKRQWQQWVGSVEYAQTLMDNPATHTAGNGMLGQLWSLRQWALSAQEPFCRHHLFFRVTWQKAFTRRLDLTAISSVNLYDWSFFLQNSAEYHIGDSAVLTLTVELNQGNKSSEFGSVKESGKLKTAFRYYF